MKIEGGTGRGRDGGKKKEGKHDEDGRGGGRKWKGRT